MTRSEFLGKYIFSELENLNQGNAEDATYLFSESDFEKVLDRVEKFGLGILSMEPRLGDEVYSVYTASAENADPSDPKWYRNAFRLFKKKGRELSYAATYEIPEDYEIEEG